MEIEYVDRLNSVYKEILAFKDYNFISEEEFRIKFTSHIFKNKLSRKELLNYIFIILTTEELESEIFDFFDNYRIYCIEGTYTYSSLIRLYKDPESFDELKEFVSKHVYCVLKYYDKNWRNIDYKKENPFYQNYTRFLYSHVKYIN